MPHPVVSEISLHAKSALMWMLKYIPPAVLFCRVEATELYIAKTQLIMYLAYLLMIVYITPSNQIT